MSWTPNRRVLAWFDRGEIVSSLLGDGDFFIPGVTYREHHDQGLILRQLCGWADEMNAWPQALEAIQAAIQTAGDRGDLETAFRLAWSAILVGDDVNGQLLDPGWTFDYLDSLLRQAGDSQAQDPEVTAIAEVLLPRLRPERT